MGVLIGGRVINSGSIGGSWQHLLSAAEEDGALARPGLLRAVAAFVVVAVTVVGIVS